MDPYNNQEKGEVEGHEEAGGGEQAGEEMAGEQHVDDAGEEDGEEEAEEEGEQEGEEGGEEEEEEESEEEREYHEYAARHGFKEGGIDDQLAFAMDKVCESPLSVAIVARDGVVVACQRYWYHKLANEKQIKDLVGKGTMVILTGLKPDAISLVQQMKEIADSEELRKSSPKVLVENICEFMYTDALSSECRPYAASTMFIGWDEDTGYYIYMLEPNGGLGNHKACAMGKGSLKAYTFMERFCPKGKKFTDLSLREVQFVAQKVILEAMLAMKVRRKTFQRNMVDIYTAERTGDITVFNQIPDGIVDFDYMRILKKI